VALTAVILAGAAARFATLDLQSYWFDEAATVRLVRLPFGQMLSELSESESAPPLYYLLAWSWSQIFGTGEVGLRSLSAALGTATIPVAYTAGRTLVSNRAGLIVAGLTALSPMLVWYSQEARAYALLVLLTAASFVFFLRSVRTPSTGNLFLWAAFSALALATHYFAVFFFAVQAAWLLVRRETRGRQAFAGVLAVAAAGLALVPLAWLQWAGGGKTAWIESRRLFFRMRESVTHFLGLDFFEPHETMPMGILLLVSVAAALTARPAHRRRALFVWSVGVVSVSITLLLALGGLDRFLYRNVIWAWLPLALGLVAILDGHRRLVQAPILGALAVISVVGVVRMNTDAAFQRANWRQAMAELGSGRGERVIVASPAWEATSVELYREGAGAASPTRTVSFDEIVVAGYGFAVPRDVRLPRNFTRVQVANFPDLTVVRYRANNSVRIRLRELLPNPWDYRDEGLLLESPTAR
jgi:4-amino-4-deoxy-L-arabinose transferase-like glycosyltransferase